MNGTRRDAVSTRHRRRHHCVLVVTLGVVGAAGLDPALGGVTYSDGVFAPEDWTRTDCFWGDGGSIAHAQQPTGGNPDEYLEIQHTLNPAPLQPGTFSLILGMYLREGALYAPGTQGAIASIDYAEDTNMTMSPFPGAWVGLGPALFQDGILFYHYGSLQLGGVWSHVSREGLTASDFIRPLGLPGPQHPDFSESGSPIAIGFFRSNSTSVDGPGYSLVCGIDNWAVTVHPVPEPAVLGLLGLGALALTRRRRKRA